MAEYINRAFNDCCAIFFTLCKVSEWAGADPSAAWSWPAGHTFDTPCSYHFINHDSNSNSRSAAATFFKTPCEASAQMPHSGLRATLKGSGALSLHILRVGLIIFLALSGRASRLDQITSSVLRGLLSYFSFYENKAFCFYVFRLPHDKPCAS